MRIRHRGKGRAVVGLDVIDDDVVNLATIEQVFERLEEALLDRTVDGVEEHDLLVEQQIVVIGHAVWHGWQPSKSPRRLSSPPIQNRPSASFCSQCMVTSSERR